MRVREGFTLIELLVVIAIIGILATLVITQLSGAQTRARNSNAKSDISEAGKAVETWKTTNNTETVFLSGAASTTIAAAVVSAGWTALFNTVQPAAAPFPYPVRISKSPSSSHTYTYETNTFAASEAAVVTGFTAGTSTATNYCVGTSVVSAGSVSDGAFYIMNSVSSSKTPGSAIVYANSATPCT
jgi:type IV pilus assembly protein PilA